MQYTINQIFLLDRNPMYLMQVKKNYSGTILRRYHLFFRLSKHLKTFQTYTCTHGQPYV